MLSQFVNDLFARTIEEIDSKEEEEKGKHFTVALRINQIDCVFYGLTEMGMLLIKREHEKEDVWIGPTQKNDTRFISLTYGTEDYRLAVLLIAKNDIIEV